MDLQMMEEDGVEEAEEEAVELELADSTDSSVLVNGNEGEEQWGTSDVPGQAVADRRTVPLVAGDKRHVRADVIVDRRTVPLNR
ncbi:hypothetical protein B296_00040045 [Ensete ventricosum]|uniref:Uncharacterized protein n=1 Tax=Ensete ventricosum TaxID=4639 RepID=A0A426YGI2_ENSVE|nr:hypothetical protein B296_00040045 [Ensete ventricosum]